jgi:hypothetical protein
VICLPFFTRCFRIETSTCINVEGMITQCQHGDETKANQSTPHAVMPVGPIRSRSAIQSGAFSLGLKHPKPVILVSSNAPPGSGLTFLNPTIAHTREPNLASIAALAGFVMFDFPARNYKKTLRILYRQRYILSSAYYGSRRSRTPLMKTDVKCSGAKMMTGTMTCYSST